jgi:hypothetical protein
MDKKLNGNNKNAKCHLILHSSSNKFMVYVAHGLYLSGLFYNINIYYIRSNVYLYYRQLIIINKSYINYMPIIII